MIPETSTCAVNTPLEAIEEEIHPAKDSFTNMSRSVLAPPSTQASEVTNKTEESKEIA